MEGRLFPSSRESREIGTTWICGTEELNCELIRSSRFSRNDKPPLNFPFLSSSILAVAAVQNNTIVVIHSVGPVDMNSWIDVSSSSRTSTRRIKFDLPSLPFPFQHPNITAVVWANLPGQESGNSCTDTLFGDYNPSGVRRRFSLFSSPTSADDCSSSSPSAASLHYRLRQCRLTPRYFYQRYRHPPPGQVQRAGKSNFQVFNRCSSRLED